MSTIRVFNWTINLDIDLITDGEVFTSLSKMKSEIIRRRRDLLDKYKLFSRYNKEKREITHVVAWDSLLSELIEKGEIYEYIKI